jgi:hypothetical protein
LNIDRSKPYQAMNFRGDRITRKYHSDGYAIVIAVTFNSL